MAMEDQNRVVMGFPPDYFRTAPRHEVPTIITSIPELQECDDPDQSLHPCLKWFILTLIGICILLLLLALLPTFELIYQNRAPIMQIESITPFNITSSSSNNTTNISTNWHLTFSLDNPNRYASIHYKKIHVSVFYMDRSLSSGCVDNFYQGKSEGHMNVDILGLIMNLEKEKINDAGEMIFTLKLVAVVRFKRKYMKNHWEILEADCGNIRVRPSMSPRLDGSGRCNVNLQ